MKNWLQQLVSHVVICTQIHAHAKDTLSICRAPKHQWLVQAVIIPTESVLQQQISLPSAISSPQESTSHMSNQPQQHAGEQERAEQDDPAAVAEGPAEQSQDAAGTAAEAPVAPAAAEGAAATAQSAAAEEPVEGEQGNAFPYRPAAIVEGKLSAAGRIGGGPERALQVQAGLTGSTTSETSESLITNAKGETPNLDQADVVPIPNLRPIRTKRSQEVSSLLSHQQLQRDHPLLQLQEHQQLVHILLQQQQVGEKFDAFSKQHQHQHQQHTLHYTLQQSSGLGSPQRAKYSSLPASPVAAGHLVSLHQLCHRPHSSHANPPAHVLNIEESGLHGIPFATSRSRPSSWGSSIGHIMDEGLKQQQQQLEHSSAWLSSSNVSDGKGQQQQWQWHVNAPSASSAANSIGRSRGSVYGRTTSGGGFRVGGANGLQQQQQQHRQQNQGSVMGGGTASGSSQQSSPTRDQLQEVAMAAGEVSGNVLIKDASAAANTATADASANQAAHSTTEWWGSSPTYQAQRQQPFRESAMDPLLPDYAGVQTSWLGQGLSEPLSSQEQQQQLEHGFQEPWSCTSSISPSIQRPRSSPLFRQQQQQQDLRGSWGGSHRSVLQHQFGDVGIAEQSCSPWQRLVLPWDPPEQQQLLLQSFSQQQLLQLEEQDASPQEQQQQQDEEGRREGLLKVQQLQLQVLQLTRELQAGVAQHLAMQPLWLVFKHWQHYVHSQQVSEHLVAAAWERALVSKCFQAWQERRVGKQQEEALW